MKKLFLIIAIFFIAISAQAQMYVFSHSRITAMKNGKAIESIEKECTDTLFIDGKTAQIVMNGEFVVDDIITTKLGKGYTRYTTSSRVTIDIPNVSQPDSITLTLAPDKNKFGYQIIYYIESIIR